MFISVTPDEANDIMCLIQYWIEDHCDTEDEAYYYLANLEHKIRETYNAETN